MRVMSEGDRVEPSGWKTITVCPVCGEALRMTGRPDSFLQDHATNNEIYSCEHYRWVKIEYSWLHYSEEERREDYMVAAEYETAWWAREHCIDAVLDGDSAIYCVPRREFNDFQEKLLLKYGVAPFLNRVNYQLSDAIARIIEPTISELLRESFPNATIEKTGELVWEIKSKEKRATISCKEYEIHRSLSVIVKPIVFYNEYDRKEFASIADALEFIRSLFSEASGE